jgi:predicted nuclease of predicted toxin-antitoxin system
MKRKFLIDAQLPPGLASMLAEYGASAQHVSDVGLGVATDRQIWQWAKRAGAVLLTKDQDFAALSRHDPSGPPVIWVRLGNTTNRALRQTFGPILPMILDALDAGERLIEVR